MEEKTVLMASTKKTAHIRAARRGSGSVIITDGTPPPASPPINVVITSLTATTAPTKHPSQNAPKHWTVAKMHFTVQMEDNVSRMRQSAMEYTTAEISPTNKAAV
jgi:hypothetical protein